MEGENHSGLQPLRWVKNPDILNDDPLWNGGDSIKSHALWGSSPIEDMHRSRGKDDFFVFSKIHTHLCAGALARMFVIVMAIIIDINIIIYKNTNQNYWIASSVRIFSYCIFIPAF